MQLTNSQKSFQLRIRFLQHIDPVVKSGLAVLRLIVGLETAEFSFLQPSEGEDHVGAKIGLDVFGCKLADLSPVLGPVCVVANNLKK